MSTKITICRPYITLRNSKRLYAHQKGLRAFCFEVEEEKVRAEKEKTTPKVVKSHP